MKRIQHLLSVCLLMAFCGCLSPMGVKQVSTREAYDQVDANALHTGKPSADTVSILHRFDLDALAEQEPDEAVRQLHEKARITGERDALFALAEMSHVAAVRISRSVKPWEKRDPRDFYLGAAVYSWLFLLGEGKEPPPGPFDRRYRVACDFYNYGLGLAFRLNKTNTTARFADGRRRLPVGEIEIQVDPSRFPWALDPFGDFLLGDQYSVRGLSVRNRQSGLGAPLIAMPRREIAAGIRTTSPATAFLRIDGTLETLATRPAAGKLELYSAFGENSVLTAGQRIPLETDLSVHMGYALNQSLVWEIERLQFLSLEERIPSGVYFSQPYEPDRIPVVFVHGTFSSPVWWAEMLNTLRADPVLRQKYQFWYFIYNSSNPLVVSANRLRESLAARIKELDPAGTNAALKQMVVIGHSQGGILTKFTATDTDDKLWNAMSTKPFEQMQLTDTQKKWAQDHLFLKPLPFVRRVVFISTPHRGSYRIAFFVRNLARRFVSIPSNLAHRAKELSGLAEQMDLMRELHNKKLTSIDGMSPRNPLLRAMAEIPVDPSIKAHSIIAVKGKGDYHTGNDGVVEYKSAHVDYAESELVVRYKHSCQSTPRAIEEVRRILHEHLGEPVSAMPASTTRQ